MIRAALTLATERLSLRWLTLDDASLMLAIWNDPRFIHHVGDKGVRNEAQARGELASGPLKLYEDYGYGPYSVALRDSDVPIGVCGLFRRPGLDAPDIGYAFLPAYCGKGYAWEAADATCSHARDSMCLRRLLAIISPENTSSIRLIEKLGFAYERPIRMPDENHDVSLYGVDW